MLRCTYRRLRWHMDIRHRIWGSFWLRVLFWGSFSLRVLFRGSFYFRVLLGQGPFDPGSFNFEGPLVHGPLGLGPFGFGPLVQGPLALYLITRLKDLKTAWKLWYPKIYKTKVSISMGKSNLEIQHQSLGDIWTDVLTASWMVNM